MKQREFLNEDYTSTAVAFLLIIITILGFKTGLPSFSWKDGSEVTDLFSNSDFSLKIIILWIFGFITIVVAFALRGISIRVKYLSGYSFVFLLVLASQIITGNHALKNLGLEIVLFSLLIGLFFSNVLGLPAWIKPLIQTELYIKIGLVLLGCGIIFNDIMQAGALGLLQSVVVVLVVWQFSFWLCRKFKIEDELRFMLSSAVAICGVSAAIATAGAINGDSKKLSYVVSLVLITAIPMMLLMPLVAKWTSMPEAVAGAWLGGTIDTTGAVVAAGKVIGEDALKYATVVKFSQNVLLGLAAFLISAYWSLSKNTSHDKPSAKTLWDRFPKFVLGFIAASLLFSFFLNANTVAQAKGPLKELQTFWFALAFVCIGLETKFVDIFRHDEGRPAYAFLIAQIFNILFTLIVAYLIFN